MYKPFIDTVHCENTRKEVETLLFLGGPADYRFYSSFAILPGTVVNFNGLMPITARDELPVK